MRPFLSPWWRSSNANPPRVNHDELVELICVVSEQYAKPGDLLVRCGVEGEAEEDHAGVGEVLPKYKLAKISIVRDENPLFAARECQHICIGQAGGVIMSDGGDIMALVS